DASHEHRHQQRLARARAPRAALTPPARALLVGGDQRAVRRAAQGEVAGASVRGVRQPVVYVGRADHPAGARRTSASRVTPSAAAASPRLTATATAPHASSYTSISPAGTSANVCTTVAAAAQLPHVTSARVPMVNPRAIICSWPRSRLTLPYPSTSSA